MNTGTNECCRAISLGGQNAWLRLTENNGHLSACTLSPAGAPLDSDSPLLRRAAAQVEQYLASSSNTLDLPIAPGGTPFQQKVWDLTRSIPAGEVRTYMWIAEQLGKPAAVRAVGQALGANPLLLFVPCHRVVRTGGALGGFACGLEWKQALLSHEAYVGGR